MKLTRVEAEKGNPQGSPKATIDKGDKQCANEVVASSPEPQPKTKYLEFKQKGNTYEVWNKIYGTQVGYIKKERCGTWMHWQLYYTDLKIGYTNGCLKEATKFITSLYSKERKK